jgi:hypothetical protein
MHQIISIFLFFVFTSSAQAAIYKCTNEYGKTVYQDRPCVQSIKLRSDDDVKKIIDSKSEPDTVEKTEQS